MKKRLVILSILIVLVTAGLALGKADGMARDQQIQSEVIGVREPAVIGTENVTGNGTAENVTITIKNPTFQEVKDFILEDTTSRNDFVVNEYECRHFATDVNNNAEAAGIRCAFVLLCYPNGQHAVVGFETTDRGMIYIEPQTDAAIQPEVGGYYQGQKIVEILVGW